ncbi:MAG: arsenite efflux transporter metallochaperone ArsD [Novosphingobium sp.]|jgi:AhpD family alkylhydroperoxidase|nr:arsenite efflux transporter metallochaperone ArsD [Novosphingobium sp.]
MTTITVYDPPMCCSTGVCGPEVDPALAQFAGDLDWLKGQGVEVRRFNLSQEPASFAENAEVKAILDQSGGDDLPAILVDGKLVAHGRYPARPELAAWAGVKTAAAPLEVTEQIKELIALGAAIGASCEPCFKFHYDKARKIGLSDETMREAVGIARAVKEASARNIFGLADRMLGAPEATAGSSCCGASAKDSEPKAKAASCC